MSFDDLAGDSKPETCASGLVGYEGLKDIFQLLSGHATAIIGDGKLYTVRNYRSRKLNFSVRMLDRFLCISENVKESLTDFCLIQTDLGKIMGDVSLEGDSEIIQCRTEGIRDTFQTEA